MTCAPEILLVDDNPADAALAREALSQTDRDSRLHVVPGGEEAIAFLHRRGKYLNVVCPDLVILDLNLPGKDGLQVLSELRSDSRLRAIPIVVFSSSESVRDIARCYERGANCYVQKPGDLKRFFLAMQSIERFWFNYASLHRRKRVRFSENDRSLRRGSAKLQPTVRKAVPAERPSSSSSERSWRVAALLLLP